MTNHSLEPLLSAQEYVSKFESKYSEENNDRADDGFLLSCLGYASDLLGNGVPVVFDRKHLSLLTGYPERFIRSVVAAPEVFYRNFFIAKKSGGSRLISEPLPLLKGLQNWVYENILLRIPVSPAAKAYVPGRRLRDAARFHVNQSFVIRMDIIDFFPSITRRRVFGLFKSLGYSSEVAGILSGICCVGGAIPQGGVCSAYLSNIIMRSVDDRLFKYARKNSLRYTRYADDFAFSGKEFSCKIINDVSSIISSEGFSLNKKKTRVMRPGSRQVVVGHVVNKRINAPREYRKDLRKVAYYINKFGLDGHLAWVEENRSGARGFYLGKAGFALSANPNDVSAISLKRALGGC